MIKRIAIVLLLIVNYQLLITPVAFAQTATSSPRTIKDAMKSLKTERREDLLEVKAERKAKMDAFKDQIRALKDTRKQMLTERISDKIASANARLTDKMDNALGHLTDILNRVKEKAAAFKAQGKDTTALDQAIAAAETAIQTAENAVDTQEDKEYTANITDELALRNTIGQMVSQFRLDIQAVHKLVVAARQAVAKAISEAAKLRGEENTATGSAAI